MVLSVHMGPTLTSLEDRRRSPRFPIRVELKLLAPEQHMLLLSHTVDLSLAGALVRANREIPVGARVRVSLYREDPYYPLQLEAEVVRVADGDAVFSPRLAGFVLDAFASHLPTPDDPELDQLTTREREVLRLLARGYAYKEIARRLSISVKTVETHASAILRKLQLSNRHELTDWAHRRRIV